ncbi:MAG: MFS transporter [Sphingomicrobium sp.]
MDAGPELRFAPWPLVALASMLVAGFMSLGSFSIMAEAVKAELHLSDTMLGSIQGISAAVPLVLLSIPIGILVDRTNRIRLSKLLVLLWTSGTLITVFATSVPYLFIGRMMVGIGTTGALTAALSLCADYAPPLRRGRAMLIVTFGKSLGQGAAFAIAGWLLSHKMAFAFPLVEGMSPWRGSQFDLGLISVALTAPMLFLREPVRHGVEASAGAPFRALWCELWLRRRFLVPLFVGQASVVMADAAAGIWAAPVLIRNFHLTPADFAAWLGATILGTGMVGAILGGFAADRGQRSGRRGGLLIGAVVAAGVGIPAALFPLMPSVAYFGVAIGTLLLAGTVTGLVTSVALTVFVPNELRGISIGAFIAFAGLIGFGIAPPLVGLISQQMGGQAHLAAALAMVGVAVSFLSLVAFGVAMRRAPRIS